MASKRNQFEEFLFRTPASHKYAMVAIQCYSDIQMKYVNDLNSLVERGSLIDKVINDGSSFVALGIPIAGSTGRFSQTVMSCVTYHAPTGAYDTNIIGSDGSETHITAREQTRIIYTRARFYSKEHNIPFWIIKRYVRNNKTGKMLFSRLFYIYQFHNPNYKRKD